MKKIIALFLTAAVLWSLAACGKKTAQTNAGTQTTAAPQKASSSAEYLDAVKQNLTDQLNAGANVANMKMQKPYGECDLVNDYGEVICNVRANVDKDAPDLKIIYENPPKTAAAYAEDQLTVAAQGFCCYLAAPFINGLSGQDYASEDIYNMIVKKAHDNDFLSFTRLNTEYVYTEFTAGGLPCAFAESEKHEARLYCGAQPIKEYKTSMGIADYTPAQSSEPTQTQEPAQSDLRHSGKTDADTFIAVVKAYENELFEHAVSAKTEKDSDGKMQIFFYDTAYTPDNWYVRVTFLNGTDISGGIKIWVDPEIAAAAGLTDSLIYMITPATAYCNLAERNPLTPDDFADLLAANGKTEGKSSSSFFSVGKSKVGMSAYMNGNNFGTIAQMTVEPTR